MREMRIVAGTGMLGYGFLQSSLEAGLRERPAFIGVDAGSTDAGPHYLGIGKPFVTRPATKRDLRLMLLGAKHAGIPLVVGSSGGAGGEPNLQWTREIVEEIAREDRLNFRVAIIHAEQDKTRLKAKLAEGKVTPLGPVQPLTAADVDRSARIVGMMGAEPIIEALDMGAEVVLAGRSSDTSIFAAMPVREGYDHGLAWHMAKLVECGAAVATPKLGSDGMIVYLRDDHFIVAPLDPKRRCTCVRVAAHTLYENPDPYRLYEPSGMLDTSNCTYEQVDERSVKVSGSRFVPADKYTIKLEGVEKVGYRTITICGTRDPVLISKIDSYLASVREIVRERVGNYGIRPDQYKLTIHVYGKDGTMGAMEPVRETRSHELGLVIEAVAETQEMANAVLAQARVQALHTSFEGQLTISGNMAFLYSPSDIEMGPVYRFNVWHLVEPDSPLEMFPIEIVEV